MKIAKALENLEKNQHIHHQLGADMLKVDDGKLFPLDILVVAVLNRSTSLLAGFISLIEKRNFVAAAPLLRLQLDNCVRLYAAWIVKEPHDFAFNVLAGNRISQMRDRTGTKMTDAYLVAKLADQYPDRPWLTNVYKQTSGYIHLSEKHIFTSMQTTGSRGGVSFKVSAFNDFVAEENYVEAIEAFHEITQLLFHIVYSWIVTKKSRPEASGSTA